MISNKIKEMMDLEGFKTLTPIQKLVIERDNPRRDLIGISSTGSGKSHAFFMPLLEQVNPDQDKVQAIVSVPTRELAYQLYQRARKLAEHFGVRIMLAAGGMEKKVPAKQPQIVIGTPGRMKDLFLETGGLRLDTAHILVIDEADMTMEFGFLEDLDAILSRMPKDTTVMVFSATIPEALQPFMKKYLHNPEMIEVGNKEDFSADIEKRLVPARHMSYQEKLLEVLPSIHPYVCLIFANTTKEAAETAEAMRKAGYDLVELHSGLEARQRNQAIREIQQQKKSYIVASDIASRGIDLEGITHVISLGFPKDLKFFTHRIGRTGRAGRDGMAIAIYKPEDARTVEILKKKGIEFKHMDVRNGEWRELKDLAFKPKKVNPLEKEIRQLVHSKKKVVKPNYKKKQKEQIERLRRKKKREAIRKDIQRQKKERAIEKQRAKKAR